MIAFNHVQVTFSEKPGQKCVKILQQYIKRNFLYLFI